MYICTICNGDKYEAKSMFSEGTTSIDRPTIDQPTIDRPTIDRPTID
jgi:hypothetical protein